METITNRNTMFLYFAVIKNFGMHSILDAGMGLKRMGAVARQAVGCEIAADALLYGIDFCPEIELPVYEKIYNQILTKDEFFHGADFSSRSERKKMDAAIMLEAASILEEKETAYLTEYFMREASGIVTDTQIGDWMVQKGRIRGYYPLEVDADRYAWIPVDELRLDN